MINTAGNIKAEIVKFIYRAKSAKKAHTKNSGVIGTPNTIAGRVKPL